MLHAYSHSDGKRLLMQCGAVSDMPEQSAPYVDTRRAFRGLAPHDQCAACAEILNARAAKEQAK